VERVSSEEVKTTPKHQRERVEVGKVNDGRQFRWKRHCRDRGIYIKINPSGEGGRTDFEEISTQG